MKFFGRLLSMKDKTLAAHDTSHESSSARRLIADLASEEFEKGKEASEALVKLGSEAVPSLIKAIHHKDFRVRWNALEALGKIADASAINALVGVLKDRDDEVRRKATWALGKIGDTRAADPVIDVLFNDGSAEVAGYAVWALGEIKGDKARDALVRACSKCRWGRAREDAAHTLKSKFEIDGAQPTPRPL